MSRVVIEIHAETKDESKALEAAQAFAKEQGAILATFRGDQTGRRDLLARQSKQKKKPAGDKQEEKDGE